LLAALLVITLIAVAALSLVAFRIRAGDRVETARDQATAAAQSDAVSILSYDYRHLDRDFAALLRDAERVAGRLAAGPA
jgi:Mce-associated membrane protein